MNLFRSEEHLRRWDGFKGRDKGIITMDALLRMFSVPFCTKRAEPDYASHMGEYLAELIPLLDDLDGAGRFFRMRWIEKKAFAVAQRLGL